MGRFEYSIIATLGFLTLVAVAFYLPPLAELYTLLSWFGFGGGILAALNGFAQKDRQLAYLGGAFMANFAVGVGFHLDAWPLAISGCAAVIACFFLMQTKSKN